MMATDRSAMLLREQITTLLKALWHESNRNRGATALRFFMPDPELRFEDASFLRGGSLQCAHQRFPARDPRASPHLVITVPPTWGAGRSRAGPVRVPLRAGRRRSFAQGDFVLDRPYSLKPRSTSAPQTFCPWASDWAP